MRHLVFGICPAVGDEFMASVKTFLFSFRETEHLQTNLFWFMSLAISISLS